MSTKSALYIVATPIGNLSDLSPRAVDVLKSVDIIAAEDTRHSGKLLANFSISTRTLPYHDYNDKHQTQKILDILSAGQSVALISDAGTPLISDPGYKLVTLAASAGFTVIPIPGPCALVAALCAAGLATDRFVFEGFIPAKAKAKYDRLESIMSAPMTSIFYESVHRIKDTLKVMSEIDEGRQIVVARELTKTYETFLRGTTAEVSEMVNEDGNQERGEFVVIVDGAAPPASDDVPSDAVKLLEILSKELPLKKSAAIVAQYCGLKKNTLYSFGLERGF